MIRALRSLAPFLRLPGTPAVVAPLILAVAGGLSACASGGSAQADASAQPHGNWQLVTLAGRSGAGQTLQIDKDGRVSGFAGCNRFASAAEVAGAGQLRFEPAAATKMGCQDEGTMRSEVDFLQMLGGVRGYRVNASALSLLDDRGQVLAEFSAQ